MCILALAICPWKLISTSSKFTTYLSAYSVFLSSVAGVVACDYFYVRRGFILLIDLYSLTNPDNKHQDSIYRYNKIGVNWRAYVAYICGILPNIVGFVGATETHKVPIGATQVYRLNFYGIFHCLDNIFCFVLLFLCPLEQSKLGHLKKAGLKSGKMLRHLMKN